MIARLQKEVFEAQAQSWGLKPNPRTQTTLLPTPTTNKHTRIPRRRLSATEMDEKEQRDCVFL